MAIIISGKTKCESCGKIIEVDQEAVSFPHFVANEMDPLWVFCDGAFHAQCFYAHPLAQVAQRRYKDLLRHNGPGNRACVVCKKEIQAPDEYFTLGHLTEDKAVPLYHYNYIQAHRSCLSAWRDLAFVIKLIEGLKDSGTWRGNALDDLLAELEKALRPEATV
jgi:hypothetical protein